MRNFTKSVLSFSWATSLFGVKQLANIFTPQDPSQPTHKATAAFNSVTHATEEQFGGVLKATFKAGDNLQKSMVDMMSSLLTLQAFNPSQMMKMTSDIMQQSAETIGMGMRRDTSGSQQKSTGWGPVSPPGTI